MCSNYSPTTVSYTWECVQKLKAGDKVVCTQPPMPFKCPGAPQKIIYLIADRLRRRGILKDCKLDFYTHAPAIFGVPYFARALVKVAARYGIDVHYQQNLVAVDGNAKTATFEFVGDNRKGEKENVPFDLLHVSPPQSPHDEIKNRARSPTPPAGSRSTRTPCSTCASPTSIRSATSARRRTPRPRQPCASRRRWWPMRSSAQSPASSFPAPMTATPRAR